MGLYDIAGLTVRMNVTGRTRSQLEPYLCREEKTPDLTVDCDPAEIMELNPHITDPDMAQYMGTGACFARALLGFHGFQLHASAVALDGKAYLFTAPGGTGKSTHTEKWCRLFGARCLNDDKPALRRLETGWTAWGTPWSGKHDLSSPEGAVLGGIACLQRGEENKMELLGPDRSVPMVMSQCLRQLTAGQMEQQLDLLDKLLQEIPVWLLTCRNEDAAALLSHSVMTGVDLCRP